MTSPLTTISRKYLGFICLFIIMVILIAGLWPFNFNPGNMVEWILNGSGIRFNGKGIVFSPEPLVIQDTTSNNDSIAIELLVRPHKVINNMVASILTLYDGNREHFIIGQWKTHLIIRVPASAADNNKRYREIGVENVLRRDEMHLITVTSNQETTDVYIDGNLEKSFRHFSLVPKDQQLSGHLVLGNSPEGTNPWNGAILGLSIYDDILNSEELLNHFDVWQQRGQMLRINKSKLIALYLFDEHNNEKIRDHSDARNDLLIPARFYPLRRIILGLPPTGEWFSRWNLVDIAVNILGFAPFGFILSAWLQQTKNLTASRAYLFSVLLGACISLTIEMLQAYLPTRDSSLMDVFSNILGTATGVFLLKYALPVLHKVKRVPIN